LEKQQGSRCEGGGEGGGWNQFVVWRRQPSFSHGPELVDEWKCGVSLESKELKKKETQAKETAKSLPRADRARDTYKIETWKHCRSDGALLMQAFMFTSFSFTSFVFVCELVTLWHMSLVFCSTCVVVPIHQSHGRVKARRVQQKKIIRRQRSDAASRMLVCP